MAETTTDSAKIALYGGAFDPVHNAHLQVVRYAIKQVGLDRVIFIPTAQSPLKDHRTFANEEQRVEMLELATDGDSRFKVDTYEVEKGGTSYTIDTVRYFKQRFPQAELFWIIGGDQFEQLDRWREIDELVQLVTFLVLARPGSAMEPCEIEGLNYYEVDAPLMEESSTEIRSRCAKGLPLEGAVPDVVEAFISEHRLYTEC